MNKYKEALDEIKNIVLDKSGDGYHTAKYLQNFYFSSCETLQELVERATPKKPEIKELIRKDNYRDGTNIPRYDWWCPNCNLEHMSGNDFKYCPSCGQALDWRDEE